MVHVISQVGARRVFIKLQKGDRCVNQFMLNHHSSVEKRFCWGENTEIISPSNVTSRSARLILKLVLEPRYLPMAPDIRSQPRAAKLQQLRHDIQEGLHSDPARPWGVSAMKRE